MYLVKFIEFTHRLFAYNCKLLKLFLCHTLTRRVAWLDLLLLFISFFYWAY